MPKSDATMSRPADRSSIRRQLPARIIREIVGPMKATSGEAVLSPMVMASRGMATTASPKPMADRMSAETKMITTIAAGHGQRFFFFRPRMPPLRNSPAPRTKPKLYQPPLLWTS